MQFIFGGAIHKLLLCSTYFPLCWINTGKVIKAAKERTSEKKSVPRSDKQTYKTEILVALVWVDKHRNATSIKAANVWKCETCDKTRLWNDKCKLAVFVYRNWFGFCGFLLLFAFFLFCYFLMPSRRHNAVCTQRPILHNSCDKKSKRTEKCHLDAFSASAYT